ncbi:MAG: hypothetical protein ACYDER_07945 [Ktedonobacteraceae bacterium]
MINRQPEHLHFSPALPCVHCHQETNHGRIAQVGTLGWQLLPLCSLHNEEPTRSDEPVAFGALRSRINTQLAIMQHRQRRTRGLARAYVRLRKFHAHRKAQRTLRWRLKRAYQAQATEVES